MPVSKFRKRPVVVEAIQFTASEHEECCAFVGSKNLDDRGCLRGEGLMLIKTLAGNHWVRHGDYIIKGVGGKFYPCKPAIFEGTYFLVKARSGMSFGTATKEMRKGLCVQRQGWNGKDMFIYLVDGSSVAKEGLKNEARTHLQSRESCGQHTGLDRIGAHINMRAADNSVVAGWLASQTDILADDWQTAEPK